MSDTVQASARPSPGARIRRSFAASVGSIVFGTVAGFLIGKLVA